MFPMNEGCPTCQAASSLGILCCTVMEVVYADRAVAQSYFLAHFVNIVKQ